MLNLHDVSVADLGVPLVSIVIPVYNGADYLQEAISSALDQDYPHIEVLVVDDGSTDDGKTQRIAESFGKKIRYIKKSNGGVASALNRGIAEMKGEYFSWLSHDDLYEKHKVSSQIQMLYGLGAPETLIFSGYWLLQGERVIAGRDFLKGYGADLLSVPLFPVFHCAVNGCTMLIHKSHFQRVGLFDEGLKTTQDYDLWFRMFRGQKAVCCPQMAVYSRIHKMQTSLQHVKAHEVACSALWIGLLARTTSKERALLAGSEEMFFTYMGAFFSCATSYKSVTDFCKEKCGEIPRSVIKHEAKQWDRCRAGKLKVQRQQTAYLKAFNTKSYARWFMNTLTDKIKGR